MKMIKTSIILSALATTQIANAQTTAQQLPPLPTTQGAQPIYAPSQQQYQQAAPDQPVIYSAQPQQVQNPLIAQQQAPASAPAYYYTQPTQPQPQQQVVYRTVPVNDAPPAGPSHTVSRNSGTQQNYSYTQPAPQQQWQQQPTPQQWQAQPAPQQWQQVQPQPAAQQFQQPVQPQPIHQLQPASGQPATQPVAQAQVVAPQPIAIPAAKAEPAPVPSATIANIPPTNAGVYVLATVSSGVPMAKASLPKDAYKTLDEDSWRQIEFTSASNQEFINAKLRDVIAFKQQNWAGNGFRNVMVRPEPPVPFQSLNFPKSRLPKTKATSLALKSGSVSDGFTIADKKSGWFMYGQKTADGKVTSLAISPDDMPMSMEFAKHVVTTAGADLILVDWYKDRIVDTSSAETVLDWANIYKPSDLVKN